MHSPNVRVFLALLAGSFAVATACGSDRQFGTRGTGGDSGEAGDSETGAGSSNHAGKGGSNSAAGASGASSSDAGDAGNGGSSGDAGESGVDTTAGSGPTAGSGGAGASGGSGGTGGAPACGGPGASCCTGNMCVANAACMAGSTCACSTNYSACGNTCVNLKTDSNNCGVCGHSCLGGTCDLGSCQPKTVATMQQRLSNMASDGTYLYWSGAASSGSPYYVARARVDGSGTVKVLAASELSAGPLALTADKVYWVAKGQLRSCDIPECASGPVNAITTVTSGGVGGDILYEPAKKALYWSRGATYNTKDGTLYTLASTGTTPTVVGTNPSNPGALVNDSGNVYWINSSTYTTDSWNADGGLWRVRTSDGTTTQLVSTLKGDISYLAISGATLYFAGNIAIVGSNPLMTTTAILSAPLPNGVAAGTQPPKFVDAKNVRGLEADGKYLYFADEVGSSGSISRCPVAACPAPETVVPGLYSPNLGAQDAVSIYFASSSSSAVNSFTIQRLAK